MALFQRIRAPFADDGAEDPARLQPRLRSVGEMLRERREDLDLDLVNVGAALRIKPAYLVALEQGRSHELPGSAYAIGFIRAYARHLGLDEEAVLNRFKGEASSLTTRPDLSLPVPLGERSLPGGAMVLIALILALCGYGTWYYLSTGERDRPERVTPVPLDLRVPPPAPPAVHPSAGVATPSPQQAASAGPSAPAQGAAAAGPAPAATPRPAVAPAPAAVAGAPADTAAAATAAAPPQVTIRASADCWIQVRGADNKVVFSGVLKAGEAYDVPRQPGLYLRTGNASALQVSVDGKPVPPLDRAGNFLRHVALDPAELAAGQAVHN